MVGALPVVRIVVGATLGGTTGRAPTSFPGNPAPCGDVPHAHRATPEVPYPGTADRSWCSLTTNG